MWVRALRLAAGVGRYKTRGDDASPAGVAGGRDLSAQSPPLSPFGFQSLQSPVRACATEPCYIVLLLIVHA